MKNYILINGCFGAPMGQVLMQYESDLAEVDQQGNLSIFKRENLIAAFSTGNWKSYEFQNVNYNYRNKYIKEECETLDEHGKFYATHVVLENGDLKFMCDDIVEAHFTKGSWHGVEEAKYCPEPPFDEVSAMLIKECQEEGKSFELSWRFCFGGELAYTFDENKEIYIVPNVKINSGAVPLKEYSEKERAEMESKIKSVRVWTLY